MVLFEGSLMISTRTRTSNSLIKLIKSLKSIEANPESTMVKFEKILGDKC
jgi:hypothetical protein